MSGGSTPTAISDEPDLIANSSDESVPWVVQKYGGTSVGKSLDSICNIVASYIPSNRVAVVCSARSSHTKALGTTNLLLQASREALIPSTTATASSPRPSASGWQTPFFPKRVGSGFFNRDQSLMSSVSSLRELEISNGGNGRSSSPSPFQPSSGRSRSPTALTPLAPSPVVSANQTPTNEQNPSNGGGPETLGESAPFHETVDKIKQGHVEAAMATLKPGPLRDELLQEIESDCENLRSFLFAAQIIDEISPRSQDSIVGTGERLACKIVAAALRDRGVDSELVVLDSIVDAAMNAATETALIGSGDQGVAQLDQSFYDELSKRLGERIRECGTRVPVITGYFGPVPGSLLAQIGRGYTDLCAALCAVGLAAAELQVWKEVDGIFTADPRKVRSARLVPSITPDEAAELTYYGSEVIHPFTMEQVIRAKIPIRIKNVENPKGCGTIILPDGDFPVGLDTQVPEKKDGIEDKLPTAVTIKDQIVVLNIHSNRKTISHGFLARIFGTLDRAGVVVDLISTSEVHVSMAMQDFHNKKRLERLVRDLEKIGDITISRDMAILSLVGRNLRNAIGSAGLMFTTLAKANVNIEMISQGASEINISCVIENKDAVKALNVIHDACIEQHGRHLEAQIVPEPKAEQAASKAAGTRSKALSVENINQSVLKVQYAVRGEIAIKADKLEHEIESGGEGATGLSFDKIVYANIGNPQAKHLDQRPLTYWRQILSLVEYPDLLEHPIVDQLYPSDVIAKASSLLKEFGSVGAYTHSKGSLAIRKRVAKFIQERDGGYEADPESIYLTGGATQGVAMILGLALEPGDGCLIPIPQYPLYTATLAHIQAHPVTYHLSETNGWALDLATLRKSITDSRSNKSVKSLKMLVVINPSNPTGSCLTEKEIKEIIQIAYDESLAIVADEVYQANIFDPSTRPFVSFKRVLSSMPEPIKSSVELVSFHSISKGMSGECGRRGGYFECVNIDTKVMEMIFKMSSIQLCPPVSGQIGVDLLVSPPIKGQPSYELYVKEQNEILDGLRSRSKYMSDVFNSLPGISCQPAEGAMYLFPKLNLPSKAIAEAKKVGKAPDEFYALELLNSTGICAVAGTGFGQEDDTFHLRVTALVPGVEEYTTKIEKFHREFMEKYA